MEELRNSVINHIEALMMVEGTFLIERSCKLWFLWGGTGAVPAVVIVKACVLLASMMAHAS